MLIKRLKLVLATSALLVGGTVGFAAARGDHAGPGHDRHGLQEKFDANKDGKLDDAERAQLKAQLAVMHDQRKAAMLQQYDSNKDGKLDDAERATMQQAKTVERFKKLDVNRDGALSLDEFKAARAHGRRGGGGHRHDGGHADHGMMKR